jgi:hypothetical protein
MPTQRSYAERAAQCIRLAQGMTDERVVAGLIRLAKEYDAKAREEVRPKDADPDDQPDA